MVLKGFLAGVLVIGLLLVLWPFGLTIFQKNIILSLTAALMVGGVGMADTKKTILVRAIGVVKAMS